MEDNLRIFIQTTNGKTKSCYNLNKNLNTTIRLELCIQSTS